MEWCSVNCHEGLEKEEKSKKMFFFHFNFVHASAGYTDIEHAGHLGAIGGAVHPMMKCFDLDIPTTRDKRD